MNKNGDFVGFYESSAGTPSAPPPEYSAAMGLVSLPLGQSTSSSPTRPTFANTEPIVLLTEKEVREALKEYAQTECSAMKSELHNIKIFDIRSRKNAYRYTVDTFSESRTLLPKSEPHIQAGDHQPTPGSYISRPDKWSFPTTPPTTFADASTVLEFPGSSIVAECIRCQGTGSLICSSCGRYNSNCRECRQGLIRCDECKGNKHMMHWKNLKIQWTTKKHANVMVQSELSSFAYLEDARGEIVFEERCSGNQALPIMFKNHPGCTETVELLFRKACSIQDENTKILELCQQIEVHQVYEVDFKLHKQTGKFYVIGKQRKVYFPQGNPTKSCTIF